MAQLADILIRAMLPLHPRLAVSPRLSIQLLNRGNVIEEIDAVTQDRDGIWKAISALELADGDQPLTLAVVIDGQNNKENLLSSTFNTKTLRAQVNARADERHEFIACDSLAQLSVSISCQLKISSPEEALEKMFMSFPNSDAKIDGLSALGRLYYNFYERSQDPTDLDHAISIQRKAIQLGYSHPQLARHLGDLSKALEARYDYSGNRTDIDKAMQTSQNALSLTPRDTPESAGLLMRLASNHKSRFKRLGDMADIDVSVSTYSEAVALMKEENQMKATDYNDFATALLERFKRIGVLEDLNRAIPNLENAVKLTPEGHPNKPPFYSNLGIAFYSRFELLGDLADLEMAVTNQENAMSHAPEGHPQKALLYSNLGSALSFRFERLGDLADLEMAVTNQENALRLTPDGHPDKASRYHTLGSALRCQFDRLGDLADLETAITNQENAVRLTPDGHPDKSSFYSELGIAFHHRFERLGVLPDLEMAIANAENAVRFTPDGHRSKPSYHMDLGNAFLCRFQRLDILFDLERAITNTENAVKLTPDGHPDKPLRYANLGTSLQDRYERLGDLADLEAAITSQDNAVRLTPDGHPHKASRYQTLGNVLQRRFERLGDLADLKTAITSLENATRLTPDGHPEKLSLCHSLGNVLHCQFKRLGTLSDLERAITLTENTMKFTPDGHPGKILLYSNLGYTLTCRFERLGVLADLEMAITYLENAVKLIPEGHPDEHSRYTNLGNAFVRRFERLGALADLEMTITNHMNALRLTPNDHPHKPTQYCNLGTALRIRFDCLGDISDLKTAITNMDKAMTLTPDGHPDKPSRYNNLGAALQSRFERLGDISDIEMAITTLENAVRFTPDGQPDKVWRTFNLADCYERRFISFSKRPDLELAHSLYVTAAQSPAGRPQQRFKAALRWSRCAKLLNNSPLPAFKCAIDQLAQIAWLGIPVNEQHSLLEEIGGTVRDAVAAATKVEEYKMAVEWVDQGRSIVWQNLLKLRTPVDDLRAVDPKLADRLQSISCQLDMPAGREFMFQSPLGRPQEVAKSHTHLAIEWDEVVDEIRKLPEFNTFLKPKDFDCLAPAARKGPVVILNVSKDRCDALALISDDNGGATIVSIPLKNFTFEKSQKLLQEMKNLLKVAGVRDGDTRASKRIPHKSDPTARFRSALRVLWMEVVKPVLVGLAYQPQTSDLPRIWWCATGPLAFLPIHAAGDYDAIEFGHKLSDYAVSSYTPTITALLDSSYPTPSKDFKLLTVAQPSAPNCSAIPKTMDEVERIAKIAGCLSVVSLAEEEATVEQVQKGIRESSWVHLACHGKQDAAKPMDSGLILCDGTLKLSEIVQENLSNAEFAFLSACQTAMGDEKVEEESVHLAAGMLLAGYKGVIATMWSIRDDDGPRVAEVVYSRMLKDGKPNRKEAAYALHDAVKQLRESGADFTSWVPFIHIGR